MVQEDVFQPRSNRTNWVRLRTLIVLRWVAIFGQLGAITVAQRLFDLQLNLGLCFLVIGLAIMANLVAVFVFPENTRLSEGQVASMQLFDIAQLSALLSLTGGLNNPFALLILAPVTISSTTLRAGTTATIGAVTIILISVVALWHMPLTTSTGAIMAMPSEFVIGFWTAIVIGVVFLGLYANRVTSEVHAMSDALAATQMALAREQKLTDLGGVVAAAAHELGTPLATIKLASAELIEELTDAPDLREDAELIRDQADRCRDILQSMGRAGKDDLLMRQAPLSAVVREAAEPHVGRGKDLHFKLMPPRQIDPRQPVVQRKPEIIHGLRNLVQNAVDFAAANVWVESRWDDETIVVRIADDGAGFPVHILNRIGDPFVSARRHDSGDARPGYEGMGLGLFIAKTLLERSGAEMTFANGFDPFEADSPSEEQVGAIVEARWSRRVLGDTEAADRAALGENTPIAS
ncbi:MAG: ActS/PrrB/RegB family redox-sensitive histidine kinase [Bacteroidota bacterium]